MIRQTSGQRFKLWSVIFILLLTLVLASCTKTPKDDDDGSKADNGIQMQDGTIDTGDSAEQNGTDTVERGETEQKTLVDRSGKTVQIPEDTGSIVSLAQSVTGTLIDLGLADSITGVDEYSWAYFSEDLKEGIAVYDMMAPDVESLLALEPAMILASTITNMDGQTEPLQALIDVNIIVSYLPTAESLEGIREDVRFLSALVGKEAEGNQLIADMDKQIDDIAKIGETISDRRSVFFEVSALPYLYSFGSEVYMNELLEIIGADNILKNEKGWLSVAEENVIEKNPDIIMTSVDYIEDPIAEILGRNGWDVITAVKEGQVYKIDTYACSAPNNRIGTALVEMAKAVYPDKYSLK